MELCDFISLFLEFKSRSSNSSSIIIRGCIALLNYDGDTFALLEVLVKSCFENWSSILTYSVFPKAGDESFLK
jgi:hypothetical protein